MATSLLSLETNHDDMVHDVAFDFYGKRLASCSSDRVIKVFEIISNEEQPQYKHLADLKGHGGPVWEISWAHPKFGSLIASCSYDRKVFVWKEISPNQWNVIYQYAGHDLSVNSIAWAPHELGLVLAAASSDGSVSIHTFRENTGQWEVKKIQAHQIGANAISWAPVLAPSSLIHSSPSGPVKRIVTGGCDNLVKIWRANEADEWVLEHSLEQHNDWVRDVAWAPSLGLPSNTIASCSQDQTVIIWTQDEQNGAWTPKPLPKFSEVVWRVSWSITGNILCVSGGSDKVSIWKESLDGNWALTESIDQTPAVH
eukprot:TRINITY_DN4268_c0_g1_i4.p1 TRINITY_DN4268_c0_g1~~TRINITY_DN4268_c0_g1_i4.p1  ORF type:complete len:312 (+),score=55.29 TRINITY_DN4268_c0_g1_i4:247-1182(+)